ncbi:MAG TPA: PelD GGDEF domain-containing protein [Burkholderiales bacterium]|jgi:hypothetical protein
MAEPEQTKVWNQLFSAETLAPEDSASRARWAEVVILPLLFIAFAWLGRPDDPLLMNTAFPWLWFGPVLVALRYGVLPGLIAGLIILGDWVAADALGATAREFPRDFFIGGSLMVLICGEFSDVWRDRNLRMDETNLYVTERLSRLTKRHLLLNLSHDRLEQEMLARPGSLRDALAGLRDLLIDTGESAEHLPAADGLLQLLAQYGNIEAATVYAAHERGTRIILGHAVATMGEPQPLQEDDELLELALEKRSLAHVAGEEVSLQRRSNQLLVAPLLASDNSLIGVLAVTKMPFFSLNVENLQMAAVILAYYADNLRTAPEVNLIRQRLPDIPVMYAEEMARMMRMQARLGLSSHIVVMSFGGERKEEIPTEFLQIKRGLDVYWRTAIGGNPVIVVLMPFASPSGKEGFVQRIDAWVRTRFGASPENLRIGIRAIDFAFENPVDVLEQLLVEP